MRLAIDPRVMRLVRRMPRGFPYHTVELALIALLAVQAARIIWAAVAPVGPVGAWRTAEPVSGADETLLMRFDPFFRLSGGSGPAVVTSLAIKLFGIRLDQASGRGSAIIATPDGVQSSYAVGDEIVPGVKLKGVAFDSVTIDRGGVPEEVFLDQSVAATVAQPGGPILVQPGGPPIKPQSLPLRPPLAATELAPGALEQGGAIGLTVERRPRVPGAPTGARR